MTVTKKVWVIKDQAVAAYGFDNGHPFSRDRHDLFHEELAASPVAADVEFVAARMATREELLSYHTADYLDYVRETCDGGGAMLDEQDTPAWKGLYEAASAYVGGTLNLVEAIMSGRANRGFIPIGGLHHAFRDKTAGFCVFNDCGIAAELLRSHYGLERVAYVDIDAHHGDGMFYAFEQDPTVFIADIHEDGRVLFPGTGHRHETGKGVAEGTKLNIPVRPRADDDRFMEAWEEIEAFLEAARPQFILFQCGADILTGDPLTHLKFSVDAHAHAARRLCDLANRHAEGRILGMGGGGYNHDNLAKGWTAVVREFVTAA